MRIHQETEWKTSFRSARRAVSRFHSGEESWKRYRLTYHPLSTAQSGNAEGATYQAYKKLH